MGDIIFEFAIGLLVGITEIVFDCFKGLTKNKRISKFVRCLLICFLGILSVTVGAGMVIGILLLMGKQWIGLLFVGVATIVVAGAICFSKKMKQV